MPGQTSQLDEEKREALLESLPSAPGVYIMKDVHQRVIYIGKAKNLRNRVRSYFRKSTDNRFFVEQLPRLLGDIEVVVTNSEKEAILLERELVGRYQPKFNIDLKDNKNFLSILLSDHTQYPRLSLARKPPGIKSSGRWFGPYTSATQGRQLYRILQQTFQLRICRDTIFKQRTRPCLQYQMQRCLGPCTQPVSTDAYAHRVRQTMSILRGRTQTLLDELLKRMKIASDETRYEDAARLRDRIQAIQESLEKQHVIDELERDQDVLGFYREGSSGTIALMQVRYGRWMNAGRYPYRSLEATNYDIVRQFLGQHYGPGSDIPPRILISDTATEGIESQDDLELLSAILSEYRGKQVKLTVPRRGRAVALIQTAEENAKQAFRSTLATDIILRDRLERLKARLHLTHTPYRIECFDMSTLAGRHSVGAMSVLINGKPAPSEYRRYQIRKAEPDSDVAMMREVLTRRFRRLLEGEEEGPDLVVLDGGLGQLAVAQTLFADLGVTDVDLVSLAKGRTRPNKQNQPQERVFIPFRKNPLPLKPGSDELYLLGLVRDEAHRFAVGYHRKLRRNVTLHSSLDEVKGLGPKLRRKLLAKFQNVPGIRKASLEQIASVPGISLQLAHRIQEQIQVLTSRAGPDIDVPQKLREEEH